MCGEGACEGVVRLCVRVCGEGVVRVHVRVW